MREIPSWEAPSTRRVFCIIYIGELSRGGLVLGAARQTPNGTMNTPALRCACLSVYWLIEGIPLAGARAAPSVADRTPRHDVEPDVKNSVPERKKKDNASRRVCAARAWAWTRVDRWQAARRSWSSESQGVGSGASWSGQRAAMAHGARTHLCGDREGQSGIRSEGSSSSRKEKERRRVPRLTHVDAAEARGQDRSH